MAVQPYLYRSRHRTVGDQIHLSNGRTLYGPYTVLSRTIMGENGPRRPYTVIDESDSATAGLARLSVLRFWLSLSPPRFTQPPTQADMSCHRSVLVGSVVVLHITCVELHCRR